MKRLLIPQKEKFQADETVNILTEQLGREQYKFCREVTSVYNTLLFEIFPLSQLSHTFL